MEIKPPRTKSTRLLHIRKCRALFHGSFFFFVPLLLSTTIMSSSSRLTVVALTLRQTTTSCSSIPMSRWRGPSWASFQCCSKTLPFTASLNHRGRRTRRNLSFPISGPKKSEYLTGAGNFVFGSALRRRGYASSSSNLRSSQGEEVTTSDVSASNFDEHDDTIDTHDDDEEDLDIESSLQEEEIATNDDDDDDDFLSNLPEGIPKGYYVVKQYHVPMSGFNVTDGFDSSFFPQEEVIRTSLMGNNVTVPIALMLLDTETYPSLSRARKACRQGSILVHRGPFAVDDDDTGKEETTTSFDPERCIRGRVGDRVYPGDVIGVQIRMGGGTSYPCALPHAKPPFELPVIYEDDHFAIVNKPAGVVVYSHRKGGHGLMTVRAALPFVLQPPKRGTVHIVRRPLACHRLDKPTSGLLLVAKTKPAMVDITRQFVKRKIKKTYMAIVNGIPYESRDSQITSLDAYNLGVDVNLDEEEGEGAPQRQMMNDEEATGSSRNVPSSSSSWQLIDQELDGKSAVTVWRALRYVKSLKAKDGTLTLVELKPKTGRYHQLRRHMAWVSGRPLVGDSLYDGGSIENARPLRHRGLFLCSNEVTLEHPYYNTANGREEWDGMDEKTKFCGGKLFLDGSNKVMVRAKIELPMKFGNLLDREHMRALRFSEEEEEEEEERVPLTREDQ